MNEHRMDKKKKKKKLKRFLLIIDKWWKKWMEKKKKNVGDKVKKETPKIERVGRKNETPNPNKKEAGKK